MKTKTLLVAALAVICIMTSCRNNAKKNIPESIQPSTTNEMKEETEEQEPYDEHFERMLEIANADYGKCYTIRRY